MTTSTESSVRKTEISASVTCADGSVSSVTVRPSRGGIITSLILHDKEVLFLDRATLSSTGGSVRGGIPILFPNAGVVDAEKFPGLPRHGFVRDCDTWNVEKTETGLIETIVFDTPAHPAYPYRFSLTIEVSLSVDGSCTLSQKVTNLETDTPIPVAMGLHPYFAVPHEMKKDITFDFPGGDTLSRAIDQWSHDETVYVDTPSSKVIMRFPELGTIVMNVSPEYQKLWIWSPKGSEYLCVEPMMRAVNGLVDDPYLLKPGASFVGHVSFALI